MNEKSLSAFRLMAVTHTPLGIYMRIFVSTWNIWMPTFCLKHFY